MRYVAYFADPIKYLKENTNFGGNFAAQAQGISYTTLEKFNDDKFILNKKTHSGKDIRVKFSVYTSQFKGGRYRDDHSGVEYPSCVEGLLIIPMYFGPCETLGMETLHAWLMAKSKAKFVLNELSDAHVKGEFSNYSDMVTSCKIDKLRNQHFPLTCCCNRCFKVPTDHDNKLLAAIIANDTLLFAPGGACNSCY